MENEDRTNVERENKRPEVIPEDHRFDGPIMARFDAVKYVEPFLKNGYNHREGFFEEDGYLPRLSWTKEDNATYMYQEKFEIIGSNGENLGLFGALQIDKIFMHYAYERTQNPQRKFSIDSYIDPKYQSRIEEVLEIDLSRIDDIPSDEIYQYIPFLGFRLDAESDEFKKREKACRKILEEDPEMIINLGKANKSPYYAYYDVCAIMDASVCNLEKGLTVPNATYFSCPPEGLLGYSIVHPDGFLQETVKKSLEKKLDNGVPIYDRGLNQISSGKGRFKDEKMKGGNE